MVPKDARGVVVDWATFDWSQGALTQSYDPDSTYAGDDVTISVGGATGQIKNNYPRDDTSLRGGLGASTQSMHVRVDFGADTETLVVTVRFNYNNWLALGASDVSLQLFNIDQDTGFIDQIRGISAVNTSGVTVGPASVSGSSDNSVTASGTNTVVTGTGTTGNNSGNGNVTIDFGTNIITELQFTFGNDPAAKANPGVQDFALYNVTFTKHGIPEVHPGLLAAVSCASVVLFRRLRLRRPPGRTIR